MHALSLSRHASEFEMENAATPYAALSQVESWSSRRACRIDWRPGECAAGRICHVSGWQGASWPTCIGYRGLPIDVGLRRMDGGIPTPGSRVWYTHP